MMWLANEDFLKLLWDDRTQLTLRNEEETERDVRELVKESNRIESIHREPFQRELQEMHRFLALKRITVEELERFVSVYQPGVGLRAKPGLDVRVGNRRPPPGGPKIREELEALLDAVERTPESAYRTHLHYEELHPFRDCNGRSGRALWAWQMGRGRLGLDFLRSFYYATLAAHSEGRG